MIKGNPYLIFNISRSPHFHFRVAPATKLWPLRRIFYSLMPQVLFQPEIGFSQQKLSHDWGHLNHLATPAMLLWKLCSTCLYLWSNLYLLTWDALFLGTISLLILKSQLSIDYWEYVAYKIALSAGPKGTRSKSAIFAGQKNHPCWHPEASGASGSGHGRAATCLTVQEDGVCCGIFTKHNTIIKISSISCSRGSQTSLEDTGRLHGTSTGGRTIKWG